LLQRDWEEEEEEEEERSESPFCENELGNSTKGMTACLVNGGEGS
jgi:hypothetical protein